jgi:hypothetical protein
MDFKKIAEELKASDVVSGKRYIGISQKTQENYISKLKTLEKREAFKNDLIKYLDGIEVPNTRIAYQTAIIGTAKHSPTFKANIGNDILDKVITSQNDFITLQKPLKGTQLKTAYESENWIDWKDLKKLTKDRTEPTQENMLIHLYTMIAPSRLDFHNLLIVRPNQQVKEQKQNYIQLLTKKKAKLVLQEYKTSQTYGKNEIDLPLKLVAFLNEYIEEHPDNIYLFEKQTNNHQPFGSPETFARYLKDVFFKLTGKKISVDLLRHSFITDFRSGDISLKAKEKVAKQMGNSVETQEHYRRID